MKILKRHKEPGAKWKETTLQECIEHTERMGYWPPESVIEILKLDEIVESPFSEWKREKE